MPYLSGYVSAYNAACASGLMSRDSVETAEHSKSAYRLGLREILLAILFQHGFNSFQG